MTFILTFTFTFTFYTNQRIEFVIGSKLYSSIHASNNNIPSDGLYTLQFNFNVLSPFNGTFLSHNKNLQPCPILQLIYINYMRFLIQNGDYYSYHSNICTYKSIKPIILTKILTKFPLQNAIFF